MRKSVKTIDSGGMFKRLAERFFALHAVRIYMSDISVRNNVYLLRGLISGILYSAFNMFAAILYNSRWFASVAIYYLLLVLTRYILFFTSKRHEGGEGVTHLLYKRCRTVGIVMLLLNIAMASIIVYTITTGRATKHSPIVVYLLAFYSISILIFNAVSVVINRKKRLPYSYLISRIISFCASLMSLFNLVNSVVYGLGIQGEAARLSNAAVGIIVIALVLFLSMTVIVKCNRRMREYEGGGRTS